MAATEYLIKEGYPDWIVKDSAFYKSLAILMESYHQSKIAEITEEEIKEAADKWEFEASAGLAADYVNEDFVAGANWALSKLKRE